MKVGIRSSNDAIARKSYCSCGYSLSPQYTHVATENKNAQYRHKCRYQINATVLKRAGLLENALCNTEAVSEMKMWIQSKYVFEHLFSSSGEAIQNTIHLIEKCKQEEEILGKDVTLANLNQELEKYKGRLRQYIDMRADGDITEMEYKESYSQTKEQIEALEGKLLQYEAQSEKRQRRLLNISDIKNRLETFVDLKGHKVSDDMIEMFVERIIYRGNDEFLWVINLSGDATG